MKGKTQCHKKNIAWKAKKFGFVPNAGNREREKELFYPTGMEGKLAFSLYMMNMNTFTIIFFFSLTGK